MFQHYGNGGGGGGGGGYGHDDHDHGGDQHGGDYGHNKEHIKPLGYYYCKKVSELKTDLS